MSLGLEEEHENERTLPAARALAAALEASEGAIVLCDSECRITYASGPAVRALGAEGAGAVRGRLWSELDLPVDLAESLDEQGKVVLRAGRSTTLTAVLPGNSDVGAGRHVREVRILPSPEDSNGPSGIVYVFRETIGPTEITHGEFQGVGLLRAVLEGISDPVFVKDMQGRYVLINSAGAMRLEAPVEAILGRGDDQLESKLLPGKTAESDQVALHHGEICQDETIPGPDGLDRIYRLTKWALRDPSGKAIGLIGVAKDVTRSREAEQALRESEQKYRLLAENSTDMISRHDPQGNYLYVSPACRTILGYEPEELLGRMAYDLIHEADRAAVGLSHWAILEDPKTNTVSFRVRHKEGHYVWLESTVRTLRDPESGEVIEIQCASRNCSARIEAEQALRESRRLLQAVIDRSAAVIYAKDLQGRYILINYWYEQLFGIRQAEFLGRTDFDIFPSEIAEAFQVNDRKVVEACQPLEFEEIAPRKDGLHTYLSVKFPLIDEQGNTYAVCGISTDITERKRAEQQLQDQNALLQEAVRSERLAHQALKRAEGQLVQAEKLSALGQMVGGVAHEVNNPLAFAVNNLAVMRRDVRHLLDMLRLYQKTDDLLAEHRPQLSAEIEALATRIDLSYTIENLASLFTRTGEGLNRIRRIVNDLRDFARTDEADHDEVDLNLGITSTANIVVGRAHKQGVELVLDLQPLPPVICFPSKINQVVLNFLSNAIDACPEGGKVTLRTALQPDGQGVAIHIKDTGHGIPAELRDRIFDPFFTTKPIGQGTGLGLSISYGIVQSHGGRIEVASAEPGHTHFVIHLPLNPSVDIDRESPPDPMIPSQLP